MNLMEGLVYKHKVAETEVVIEKIETVVHYKDLETKKVFHSTDITFIDCFTPTETKYVLTAKDIDHLTTLCSLSKTPEEYEAGKAIFLKGKIR